MADYIDREKIFSIWRSMPAPASVTSLAAAISQTPAADVVEVRHGRWETAPYNGVYDTRCSACGFCPGIRFFSSNYCPYCGALMTDEAVDMVMERSVSIGWKCEGCNGFIDMSGQFHEHKDEPFMPPMTNADRIRAMSDEELSDIFLRADFCKYCEHEKDGVCNYICAYPNIPLYDGCKQAALTWLQQPAEEDT